VKVGKGIIRDELFKIKNDKACCNMVPTRLQRGQRFQEILWKVLKLSCAANHPAVSKGIK